MSRLVRSYRVVVTDLDRPHASEATYLWRYTTERQHYELFERVISAILTNPLDRLSLNALLYDAIARIKRDVLPCRSPSMTHWGWTCGIAKRQVKAYFWSSSTD